MEIKKVPTPDKTTVYLSGIIDETTQFTAIGPVSGKVEFNGKGVTKINSNGVKSWINYFTALVGQAEFSFSELSPVLVEQLNSLSNFCAGQSVHSLVVPFACTKCHKETLKSMKIPELKSNPEPAPIACPHCGGTAEFDDLPEEYFCCLENLD
jgi:hypothetical protein